MTNAATRLCVLLAFAACASAAAAQQLYRWTDDKGRVHLTDTPPPSQARDVKTEKVPAGGETGGSVPYALQQPMANFPVSLYTSTNCQDVCTLARGLLNKRGIPFREVVVKDAAGIAELKKISGGSAVPVLTVGRSVQTGFDAGAYDSLLDSAGYPSAGVLPARNQTAPAAAPAEAPKTKEAQAAPPAPAGPYAPKPPKKPQAEPPKVYAPIPGNDKPLTGPYGKAAEETPQQAPATTR